MKRIPVVAVTTILSCSTNVAQSQTLQRVEIKSPVEKADSLDLPQTTIRLAEEDYQRAKHKGDDKLMLRSTLQRLSAEQRIGEKEVEWFKKEITRVTSELVNPAVKTIAQIVSLMSNTNSETIDSILLKDIFDSINKVPIERSTSYSELIEVSEVNLEVAPNIKDYLLYTLADIVKTYDPESAYKCYDMLLQSQVEGGFSRMITELLRSNNYEYDNLREIYIKYKHLGQSSQILELMASMSHSLNKEQLSELLEYSKGNEEINKYLINRGLSIKIPKQLYPNHITLAKVISRDLLGFGINLSIEDKIKEYDYTLSMNDYPNSSEKSVEIYSPAIGMYSGNIYVNNLGDKSNSAQFDLSVSRIATAYLSEPQKLRLFAVDLISGKPIKRATLHNIRYNNKESKPSLPILDGVTTIENQNFTGQYRVVADNDSLMPLSNIYHYNYAERETNNKQIQLTTDKPIYQPGETIHIKGIIWQELADTLRANSNETVEIIIKSPNGKDIYSTKLTSNNFGSIYCNSVIPKSGINGLYNIIVRSTSEVYANQPFRVEAYKTPTILVTLLEPKSGYSLEREFEIMGEARSFSGIAIANSRIKYKVELQESWWRLIYPNKASSIEYTGELVTDNIGQFFIPIVPERLKQKDSKSIARLTLKVTAYITDAKGETKEQSIDLPLGKEAILISCDAKQFHEKSQPLIVETEFKTHKGLAITGVGRYTLKQKNNNTDISSGVFSTNTDISIITNKLKDGLYKLELTATDDLSSDTLSREILIYDKSSKKMPIDTTSLLIPTKEQCGVGEKGSFLFGSSFDKIWVRYTHFLGKETHQEKWIELSKGLHQFEVETSDTNKESKVILFFVKDGQFFKEEFTANVTKEIDSLEIRLNTFRDRLRPGDNESWSVDISTKSGKHPKSELAAWMYDAALDQLIGNRVDIYQPTIQKKSKYYTLQPGEAFSTNEISIWPWNQLKTSQAFTSGINLYGYYPGKYPEIVLYNSATKTTRMKSLMEFDANTPMAKAGELLNNGMTSNEIREKFNQTAFFFPSINPDSTGKASFDFTLPQAITTWKLKLVAHTQDLRIAKLDREIIAQKEMMIEPNLPRFIRQGDLVTLSSKLSFISSDRDATTVTLELFDPLTNKVWHNESKVIDKPEASSIVSFKIAAPMDKTSTGFRITAQNSKFKDGEQHIIAILPDREILTESNTTRANPMSENSLSIDITEGNYTLEVVKNPTWYAVQALSSIRNNDFPNAISVASNMIANAIGASLAKSNPNIKSYIESGQNKALLGREREVKITDINNTPWVDQANRESAQVKDMIQLFDANLTDQLRRDSFEKLLDLQSTDGGFAWCSGMRSSAWQTSQVLLMLGMLPEYADVEFSQEEKMMLIRALAFIDNEIVRISIEQEKNNTNATKLNSLQINILKARSLYRDIPITGETLKRHREWIERAKISWTKETIDKKVAIANILFDYGIDEVANSITESIFQYGVKSLDYGFYFPSNRTERIETHVAAMKLFARDNVAKSDVVELMKLWLISQKRNRVWQTTPESIQAVYALLNNGHNLLESNQDVSIYLGDSLLNIGDTNYTELIIPHEEITKAKGKFKIRNNSSSPAYSTIYRQWLAEYKTIQVSKNSNFELTKEIIFENDRAFIGSKAKVRLTLKCKQSSDFVLLEDTYAGCFQPVNTNSGYTYQGIGAYKEQRSGDIRYFIEHLPKGLHTFEYDVWIDRIGNYSTGVAKVQSLYNPELVNHSLSSTIIVE
ncbi:MAG: MG2 domain-containing protein [Bacteroidales bacterium]